MNDNLKEAARTVLINFMNDMNRWESWAYQLYQPENGGIEKNKEKAKEELEKIYSQYLTKKSRKTGRLAGPNVSSIPEYNINEEQIERYDTSEKERVLVYTRKHDHNIKDYFEYFRYLIIYKNGQCLIDKKEILTYDEKWKNMVF